VSTARAAGSPVDPTPRSSLIEGNLAPLLFTVPEEGGSSIGIEYDPAWT